MTTSIGRTSGSTATPKKATFSYWLKGRADGTQQGIWGWHRGNDAANYWLGVYYSTNDSMYFNWKQGGSYGTIRGTSQKFRDPSAWGHHVISIDSTLSTAADRVKWYVNGERITSFEDSSYTLAENATITNWSNSNDKIEIGTWYQSSTARNLNNHCLSHFHFTDGYVYQASDFGSTDSTTGQWKINTSPSVTYGNEGFFILKDGNTITDSSPNSNNFSLDGGTLTKTEDCPSNNFATFNPLDQPNIGQLSVYTYGNTVAEGTDAGSISGVSTLGASAGKYYAEFKMDTGHQEAFIGVVSAPLNLLGTTRQADSASSPYENNIYCVTNGGAKYLGSTGTGGFAGTFTSGDILGVGLDCDNNRLYFSKGGQWTNGSGAYNSATPSGYITLPSGKTWQMIGGDSYNSGYARWSANFGNGTFKGVAVSSAGTNASGNGIFEYDTPTGYTALSTKGLNL